MSWNLPDGSLDALDRHLGDGRYYRGEPKPNYLHRIIDELGAIARPIEEQSGRAQALLAEIRDTPWADEIERVCDCIDELLITIRDATPSQETADELSEREQEEWW